MKNTNYLVVWEGETHLLTTDEAIGLQYIDINNGGTLILQGVTLNLIYLRCFERGCIMGSGTIRATQSIYFDSYSEVDLSQISIELDDITMAVLPFSNLTLRDFPIKGIGSKGSSVVSFEPLTDSIRNEKGEIINVSITGRNPNGVTTTLNAPCRQIFKNIKVTGQVVVDEAYPEWFAEENSINAKPLADWSPAINAAFDITSNGIVRLQSRRYLVQTTIWVPTRGQLIGSESGSWPYPRPDYITGKYLFDVATGTVLQVNDKPSLTGDCLILVNYSRSEVETATSNNLYADLRNADEGSKLIQTEWVYPGGKIANIRFINKNYGPGSVLACCILVSGCMSFENLRIQQFRNAIVWSRHYADQKEVIRCCFQQDRYQNENDYLLDFNNLGDALICKGNNFDSQSSSKANFLRINQCFGGTISDNIINGNIEIVNSKGIEFTGNHIENGAQMIIRKSALTIANNYFHKGLKPNIRIESDEYSNVSVVNLVNNSFIYLDQYDYTFLKEGHWQTGILREISEFDIELCGYVDLVGTNRYEHGPVATININNTFRYFNPLKNAGMTYPLGINICKSFRVMNTKANDTENSSDTTSEQEELIPVENFNQRSQLYSTSCALNVCNKVIISSPGVTIGNLNTASVYQVMVNSNVEWILPQEPQGTEAISPMAITYYYQFIWDEIQGLVTPNGRTPLVPIGTVKPELGYNEKGEYIPSQSKGVLINLSQNSGFGCTGLIRLFRTPSLVEDGKGVDYVDVPVVNCRILYDNGISICGYKWKAATSIENVTIVGKTPTEITYMGDKVLTE